MARALAAFRDASRAARDAERRSTVTLRPADVAGADAAAAPDGAPPNAAKPNLKPSAKRAPTRARRAGDKAPGPALSPSEVSVLVARAEEARVAVRRALHARAREIRSSLADLPDALARLRERAAPLAALERRSSGKPGVAARLSAAASPRGSSGGVSARGSFLDADEADADDGWSGRGRYDSRATMAVLGSE